MRRGSLALATLAAVAAFGASGCVGTVSRSDGEGPLPRSLTSADGHFEEVGGGAGGVVLRDRGTSHYLLATSRSVVPLGAAGNLTPDLTGARWAGSALYVLHGTDLERRALEGGDWLAKPETVAKVEGARAFAVLEGAAPGADTLAIVHPGEVLAGRAGALATLWQGEAIAVDLDPVRAACWIVGHAPLATIDCVSLDDGRVLFRVPLPRELESASVRVVRSGKGVAVYALDRPIEAALLLSPEAGVARRLVKSEGLEDARGSFDDASLPPLLLPPGRFEDERLSTGLPPESARHTGRVVCMGLGRFAVIDDRRSDEGLRIEVVTTPEHPADSPQRVTYGVPEGWPRAVESVGWDEGGAFVTSGDRRLVLGRMNAEIALSHPTGEALRHGANHAINGVLLVGEVGATVVVTGGVVGLVLVAIPVALVALPIVLIAAH